MKVHIYVKFCISGVHQIEVKTPQGGMQLLTILYKTG